jgi:hypothetical protein
MTEMTVGVRRANLGSDQAMRYVSQLLDIQGFDGLRKTRPTTARLVLIGGGEQRLARYDIDVDPGLFIVQIFSAPRPFCVTRNCSGESLEMASAFFSYVRTYLLLVGAPGPIASNLSKSFGEKSYASAFCGAHELPLSLRSLLRCEFLCERTDSFGKSFESRPGDSLATHI